MIKRTLHFIATKLPQNHRVERIWKLAQVDFKKRYYNDSLGLVWALLNPILRVSVYTLVFTFIFPRLIDGIDNFPIFLFCGLIIWFAFTETVKKCMIVLKKYSYLIESIQFDKLDLYIATTVATVLGFSFNFFVFLFCSIIFGLKLGIHAFAAIFILFTLFLLSCGIGMIVSIIYIYFKDINHILDIAILLGFWSSGVFIKSEIILNVIPQFAFINPFLGIIMNMRLLFVFNESPDYQVVFGNLLFGIAVFCIGIGCVKRYAHKAFEYI